MTASRSDWTDMELDKLKEIYKTHTLKRIAFELDRTQGEIIEKMNELGLTLDSGNRVGNG